MKRIAAFLILAFAVAVVAQTAPGYRPPPPDNNWAYGPRNSTWSPSWNRRPDPRDGACFYTTAPFKGNHFCVRAGDRLPHLPSNFGDNISSIQIFGRATVIIFNDANFRNGRHALRRSVANLRNLRFRDGHTWNNRISSIIVY